MDELERNPSEHNESSAADDQLRPNRLLSDEKLSNIMDYLHKIEANDRMADIDLVSIIWTVINMHLIKYLSF